MNQILLCLCTHFVWINAGKFTQLDDELSHILSYLSKQKTRNDFRYISRPCNNAFNQSNTQIMGHINTLQDLFRTLDQESLSHNQTNEILSSISKIHHHRSVMLNELYLLTLPHIIHKWHQKIITGTNSSANRDYKIQQIKQIFDLVPIGSRCSLRLVSSMDYNILLFLFIFH
eukprot:1130706_1